MELWRLRSRPMPVLPATHLSPESEWPLNVLATYERKDKMADPPIPGIAADEVATLLTANIKRPDGKEATSFKSQATGLKVMRTRIEQHGGTLASHESDLGRKATQIANLEQRVAAVEARPVTSFP